MRRGGSGSTPACSAPYGQLPDLAAVDFGHDVIFT
jgi:hypothetical protein